MPPLETFQYCAGAGIGDGYVMVIVIVSPSVRPVTVHEKNPCGNETPEGLPVVGRLASDTAIRFVSSPLFVDNVT